MSSLSKSLPGEIARRWLARIFSSAVMESIFDPFLADLQADWLDAMRTRRAGHARWRLFCAYASLCVQVATCALGALAGSRYALAPTAGAGSASVEGDSFSDRVSRRVAVIGVALLITFGLFVVMSSLVAQQAGEFVVKPPIKVDYLRARIPPEPVDPVRPKLPAITESKPLPPRRGIPVGEHPADIDRLPEAPRGDWGKWVAEDFANPAPGALPANQNAGPKVRVEPVYPQHALARGIQGWVVVEFTVTEVGSVANPVVIDAQPGSVFNAAALRAVARWKYQPMVVDGEAVARSGMRTRLVFQIDRE